MYPDFIGIGAQKAGTTWLHRNLQLHPQIWMPEEKELHYFDEKIKQDDGLLSRLRGDLVADVRWRRQLKSRFRRFPGGIYSRDLAWNLRYFFGRPSDEWYASLFEPGRGSVVGEITPDYSVLGKESVAHVHELMPEAKIIFMMRNPIERLWSATDMRLRSRGRSLVEIQEAKLYRQLAKKRTRILTDYLRTLENWGSFYAPEQIFVGFLEDVHFFSEQTLDGVYRFLEVDASVEHTETRRKVHSSYQSTMPTKFATYLARSQHEALRELSRRFGGYASFWLYCAERLINDPPSGEHVVYPLWGSEMWKQWEETEELKMQSGPLASVQISS